MASVDGSKSVLATSDEINCCGSCSYRGSDKEAESYCNECQEYLCGSCTESHKGLKITRSHQLLLVTDVSRPISQNSFVSSLVLCGCSQNIGVSVYCEDHNDVICLSCQTVRHRKCQTVSLAEQSSSSNNSKLHSTVKKLTKVKDGLDEILTNIRSDLENLVSFRLECQNDIKQFRQELNSFLDTLETAALKESENRESLEKEKTKRRQSSCLATKQLLVNDLKLADQVTKDSDGASIFATEVKLSAHLKEYKILLHDICQETESPAMTFERNSQLIDIQNKIKEFGSLKVDYSQTYMSVGKPFSELHVGSSKQLDIKLPGDTRKPYIDGCTFLQDGTLLLCDEANRNLKLLSSSFRLKEILKLPSKPWDVSATDCGNAIITLPELMQLQFIDIVPKLNTGRVIQLDKNVYGVDTLDNEIYVTCFDMGARYVEDSCGEIQVLNKQGNLIRKLGLLQDGSSLLRTPFNLKVSPTSGKVYVVDPFNDSITCLKPDNSLVYQYKDSELVNPRGLAVDNEDNIVVCGGNSNNVKTISADGKKATTLVSSEDGIIKSPFSIAYRATDNTLVVGSILQNSLLICKSTSETG